MPRLIIDSDLLSDLLKGTDPVVVANVAGYKAQHRVLSFTSLTALEILSGLQHIQASAQLRRAEDLFARNDEIVPEIADYRLASEIIGALWRVGKPVGFIDPTLAACAIRRGYGVATANVNHFEFIRDVGYRFHLENWRRS